MNLPRFSVARPVLTSMATLAVLLLGSVGLSRLQVDILPEVELPTVSVRTEYEGASPEVMESLVTQIVEEIIATVPGVIDLRSQSARGTSNVEATFGWGTPVDQAAIDVRSKLEDELSELPEGIERPQVRKFDISSFPVVLLGISSPLDPVELTEIVENRLRRRFSRIPNIAQVDLWGGYPREIRVELDHERLQALGLPIGSVLTALENANLDLPAGQIEDGRLELTLRAPAEFQSVDEVASTVVAVRDGATVTIAQIGRVEDTYERLTRIIRVNGDRGIRLAIRKQSGANTVEVATRILAEVEAINQEFRQLQVVPVIDQGNFIERSIDNVARSVLYGGGLSIVILLLFLLSVRSTLAVALAMPIALAGSFALLYGAGLTLNLTTLGGLALGIGMMLDSSIVVLENIHRRRTEEGEAAATAAVAGANEVAGAIVASTLTTLVVFLPLVFVRGVTGILFRELAYVVSFSLLVSLVVSLSVLPMIVARLFERGRPLKTPAWAIRIEDGLERMNRSYGHLARSAFRRPLITLGMAGLGFGLSLALIPQLGSEFLPPSDEGEVRVQAEMEVGTRLDILDRTLRRVEAIVMPAVPERVASVTSIGPSGRNPEDVSQGEIRMSLGPADERSRSNVAIARSLRAELEGAIPGATVRVRAPQGSFILERLLGSEEGLTIEVRGFRLDRLDALAAEAAKRARAIEGITDVDVSRSAAIPEQAILIDRAKVAQLGLTVRDVARTIEVAVSGAQAGEYRSEGNAYRIWVRLREAEHVPIDEILALTLTTNGGEAVTLRNLVKTRPAKGPLVIERRNQERLVTVAANVAGRDLGSVAAELQARLDEIPIPAGYEVRLAGAFEEQVEAFRELLLSLVLALLLVYMVLASQYESLVDPFVVMLAVPFASVGIVLLLLLTGTTLNVQSYIGCIMVGGIVVNNAILLVDQANALRQGGLSPARAALESGRRRLRPVLMTTATTVLGLLPLALGVGEGADAQAPLARAVVGGLLGSTPITLLVVPLVHALIHRRGGAGT